MCIYKYELSSGVCVCVCVCELTMTDCQLFDPTTITVTDDQNSSKLDAKIYYVQTVTRFGCVQHKDHQ